MRDIVEQAMRGDREAFAWLVNQTGDRMYAVATRILRDTHLAEDALQSAVLVLRDAVPELQATSCSGNPETGVDRTPVAFLDWLRTVPGLSVGATVPISIDGRDGAYADLEVDGATLVPCSGDAVVEYMIAGGEPQAIFSGGRQRLILLDNGNGGVFAIQLSDSAAAEFPGFVDEAMPIVEGMHFK